METIETLGKYEIKRPLGRGAMGTVYEGWDPIIARRVAIKTVRLPNESDPETEEALARFRREAQAAGRLNHPNIVGVFDYGETSDLAYIVMEFVDGPPLKSLLDKQDRFALADTVRIMEDLLAGLHYSHERGVVHRDIKPANVMLTGTGQAKIADFGIARIESSSMTQAGTVLGTPAYMSPEQFMGQVVDARTDIYSSGVLLYQLLTGERPFEGGMSAIMHKALNTDPPSPSQLSVTAPPSFDAVVRRAMARRPEDRYRSATDFAAAIRAAVSASAQPASQDEATQITVTARPQTGTGVAAVSASRVMPASQTVGRLSVPVMAAGAVVLLAFLGGAGWWFLLRAPAPIQTQVAAATAPAPAVGTPTPRPESRPAAVPAGAPAAASNADRSPPPAPSTTPSPPAAAPAPVPAITAPPSPPPSVTNAQVAAAGLDAMRRQIAQYIAGRHCALLGGDLSDNGSVAMSGFVGSTFADELRQGIDGITSPNDIDWRVGSVDPVFCPALDALRPSVPAFGNGGFQLGLRMADDKTPLRDGEPIRLRLVMPGFAGWLRVDYIAHDRSVQHLYPQLAEPKVAIKADLPRTYGAGEPVDLGHPSWLVGPPYGTDMIIAVASSEPLFSRPRPRNQETAEAYLRDLQTAITNAAQHGVRLAGAATTLETLP
jgi:eukaryotic-like serine/threonine-protein kinase